MTAYSSPKNKSIRLQRILSIIIVLGLLSFSFSLMTNNVTPAHAQAPVTETPVADTPVSETPAAKTPAAETPVLGTGISPLVSNSIVFHKSYPTNGLAIFASGSTTVQLEWTDAGIDTTSDKYEYCIDETNNNNCDTSWNARKSLHSGPGDVVVVPGHTYYWQVRTQNNQTQADSGVWWSFAVVPLTVTITGNTGVTSVTLSYFDVTSKTVVSSAIDGSYTITVPGGWTGTVTPSKTGWAFTPAFRSYANLAANQVSQNYVQMPLITGSTGVNGTTVVYVNGGSHLVTTDSFGNYSIAVPLGWQGTVTPIQNCTTFTPVNRDYTLTPVNAPLTSQNFAPSLNAGCANISAVVAGTNQGIYNLASGESTRVNYAGLNNGPVVVQNSGLVKIIAAERDSWWTGTQWTSYAQLMGLPSSQLSDKYVFPAYNNVTLDEQMRIANVDPTLTSVVTVTIGGVLRGTYTLLHGQSVRDNYVGVNDGPVIVAGTPGVKIIAAERDSWWDGTQWTSFAQTMGLPASQISDTYVFPAYNNVTLDEQIRIGNVDPTLTSVVTVTIGGVLRGTYTLLPNQSVRDNYAGVDSGPVVVQGTSGVKIIAAERDSWWTGTRWSSFAQLMGLPSGQISDTYVFPGYNNVSLDEQLRIGNVDPTFPSTVQVTIGGVVQGSYTLTPGQSVRVNYTGLDSGPVVVQGSAGIDIIAAERDSWWSGTQWTSYIQTMGLPSGLLSTAYYFPAYNNVTLDEQLRFGVP